MSIEIGAMRIDIGSVSVDIIPPPIEIARGEWQRVGAIDITLMSIDIASLPIGIIPPSIDIAPVSIAAPCGDSRHPDVN